MGDRIVRPEPILDRNPTDRLPGFVSEGILRSEHVGFSGLASSFGDTRIGSPLRCVSPSQRLLHLRPEHRDQRRCGERPRERAHPGRPTGPRTRTHPPPSRRRSAPCRRHKRSGRPGSPGHRPRRPRAVNRLTRHRAGRPEIADVMTVCRAPWPSKAARNARVGRGLRARDERRAELGGARPEQ